MVRQFDWLEVFIILWLKSGGRVRYKETVNGQLVLEFGRDDSAGHYQLLGKVIALLAAIQPGGESGEIKPFKERPGFPELPRHSEVVFPTATAIAGAGNVFPSQKDCIEYLKGTPLLQSGETNFLLPFVLQERKEFRRLPQELSYENVHKYTIMTFAGWAKKAGKQYKETYGTDPIVSQQEAEKVVKNLQRFVATLDEAVNYFDTLPGTVGWKEKEQVFAQFQQGKDDASAVIAALQKFLDDDNLLENGNVGDGNAATVVAATTTTSKSKNKTKIESSTVDWPAIVAGAALVAVLALSFASR